jgi:hypothetical protein
MNPQKEIYSLIHHLRNCPAEFFVVKDERQQGQLHVALLCDLIRTVYGDYSITERELPVLRSVPSFAGSPNETSSMRIGVWFFHHPMFNKKPQLIEDINRFLTQRLRMLSTYVNYQDWLNDEDRAEEFVREALQACGIELDGETADEAQDRLDALSTLKRHKVLQETNESLLRMKAVREAMAAKKAREAANVYGRE